MIEFHVEGSTDKTVRFAFVVGGQSAGELQMSREDFTRVADLCFEKNYKVIQKSNGSTKRERVEDRVVGENDRREEGGDNAGHGGVH